MDISLELDNSYHERQKEKKPEASKSNSSHHQNSSSSSHKKKNFHSQKQDKPHSSLLNKDFKWKGSEKKEESGRACVLIVVGRIVLSSVSKGLKTSLPNHQAVFPAREKPERRSCCVQCSSLFSIQSTVVHSEYWCQ
ncbi:hypothetical protein O181_069534 [Austropuccinia psidii MF-1]|uniref:Uncharacterized protein n=1 Tax=Austropuccinia psidii MF-1 TaxID=1389203 RepID=A0A9Q3EZH3_9BASI|nr:hypothetical protein [Austropuccinia psidii MF-1]